MAPSKIIKLSAVSFILFLVIVIMAWGGIKAFNRYQHVADANNQVKALLKDKQITEDEASASEADIQKITDGAIKDVDEVIKGKEVELMSV